MSQHGAMTPAQVQAMRAREAELRERSVMISTGRVPEIVDQVKVAGYRLMRTFSDVLSRPHRIYRAGEMLTDPREIERLARHGAQLEVIFEKPEAPVISEKPEALVISRSGSSTLRLPMQNAPGKPAR